MPGWPGFLSPIAGCWGIGKLGQEAGEALGEQSLLQSHSEVQEKGKCL